MSGSIGAWEGVPRGSALALGVPVADVDGFAAPLHAETFSPDAAINTAAVSASAEDFGTICWTARVEGSPSESPEANWSDNVDPASLQISPSTPARGGLP